jgi:hypothetical protein
MRRDQLSSNSAFSLAQDVAQDVVFQRLCFRTASDYPAVQCTIATDGELVEVVGEGGAYYVTVFKSPDGAVKEEDAPAYPSH